jgi:hypothetical protein
MGDEDKAACIIVTIQESFGTMQRVSPRMRISEAAALLAALRRSMDQQRRDTIPCIANIELVRLG